MIIFKKKNSKTLSTFFRSTKLIFRALPTHLKSPYFGQILCAAVSFLKNETFSDTFRRHFFQHFDQKFGARSPHKISICWRQRHLKEKFQVSRLQMDIIFLTYHPFDQQGVESLKRGVRPQPHPPNALLLNVLTTFVVKKLMKLSKKDKNSFEIFI